MPHEKTVSEKKRLLLYFLLFISITSILIAIFLGNRIFQRIGHRPPPIPRQTDVNLIQEWMTIPFIARSYSVPEPLLFEKLGIDHETNKRSNLSSLATKSGRSTQQVIDLVKETITTFQANPQPAPPN